MHDLKGVVAKACERHRSIILMILFFPFVRKIRAWAVLQSAAPKEAVQLFFAAFSPLTIALGRLK